MGGIIYMASSNPVLKESMFDNFMESRSETRDVMTVTGTADKAMVLLALVVISGFLSSKYLGEALLPIFLGGTLATLALALAISFLPKWSGILAPLYAVLEGACLGCVSMLFEELYPGIVMQAVCYTLGVAFIMFTMYRLRLIVVTNRMRVVVMMATLGVAVFYGISILLSVFGVNFNALEGGIVGLIINVVVVGLAALNLMLDFDTIERGVQAGAPKYMEWYCAFGLMVTLVWLYLEILKLLGRSRR